MAAAASLSDQGMENITENVDSNDRVLLVADMGLDFRSYHNQKKSETRNMTNLTTYHVEELVGFFEVTAGILFHCLRQCWKASTLDAKKWWLSTYSQFLLENNQLKNTDEVGESTVNYVFTINFQNGNPDQYIQELCSRFDRQFPPKNSETTWDRIRKMTVQAAFCNIHTSGRNCDAKYCNQLHLRNINEEKNHRFNFYASLIELLEAEGVSDEEIQRRLVDAMFFARHGNECTVRFEGKNIAFFDTTYTFGRLNHSCRGMTDECRCSLYKSEQCHGIHVRKCNGVGPKDRRELVINRPLEVLDGLERDAKRMMELVKEAKASLSRRPSASHELSRSSSTYSSITSTVNRFNAENQVDDDELSPIPLYV